MSPRWWRRREPAPEPTPIAGCELCKRTMLVAELLYGDVTGPLLVRESLALLGQREGAGRLLADISTGDGERIVLRLEPTAPQPAELYLGAA